VEVIPNALSQTPSVSLFGKINELHAEVLDEFSSRQGTINCYTYSKTQDAVWVPEGIIARLGPARFMAAGWASRC
jgi:hypothetical protein